MPTTPAGASKDDGNYTFQGVNTNARANALVRRASICGMTETTKKALLKFSKKPSEVPVEKCNWNFTCLVDPSRVSQKVVLKNVSIAVGFDV